MRVLISMAVLISAAYAADFTTYIGTGVQNPDYQSTIGAIAADSEGDTYVTGSNAFVTKLDPAGNVVFTKTFGAGANYSFGFSIAVDPAGNVWVGGQTLAADLTLVSALQSSAGSDGTGLLIKMSPDGTVLYASYFGGMLGSSSVTSVATDQRGNVYVTGWTDASDFPTTKGLPASPVSAHVLSGAFVTKLDSSGQKIVYSAVIGHAAGSAIAVDGGGNAFVAGATDSSDLPVTMGRPENSGAFALKINAAGSQLDYLTFLGAPSTAIGSIAVDASGNTYLGGSTNSPAFPTTPGAYQRTFIPNSAAGNADAFAMQLDPEGATIWSTFLFGANGSAASAIAIDHTGKVWLTGTSGAAIPVVSKNPPYVQATFVAELSADGSSLPYAAGFSQGGAGRAIAVGSNGVAHVAGSDLASTITPGPAAASRIVSIVNAAPGTVPDYTDRLNGLVAPGEIISIYGVGLGPTTPVGAVPQNGFFPTSLGGVQVLVNGSTIPLLYVSAAQINAELPSPLDADENGLAVLQINYNSVPLPAFRVAVAASVFGVFQNPGSGSLAVINQDGTFNSPSDPAKPGSYISIYATGFGSVSGLTMDGAVAATANNYCPACQITFITYSYDVPETVQYFGLSPGLIDGLTQINVQIPPDAPGTLQVWFTRPESTLAQQLLGFVQVSQ
jgi:uncharacterized protein (TIGR03437 family)